MHSFSSVWYWIGLAVIWSSVSHWVLGVPFDMIYRARRRGGQTIVDLADLVRVNVNRISTITQTGGAWLAGFSCFVIAGLGTAGFYYGSEMSQAFFLVFLPMNFVAILNILTANKIAATKPEGDALIRVLMRLRIFTQVIAMLSIFVTAMYGMYYNLSVATGF